MGRDRRRARLEEREGQGVDCRMVAPRNLQYMVANSILKSAPETRPRESLFVLSPLLTHPYRNLLCSQEENLSFPDTRIDRLFQRRRHSHLTEPTLLERFKSIFRRRDSRPFAGFTELARERGSVLPWEEFGSPQHSTLGSFELPPSQHQPGPAAKRAASSQAAEATSYERASDALPGVTIPGELHDWSGIRPSRTTKPDIARTGSNQIQPDCHPLDLHGSSSPYTQSDLGLDLPAFASRPAQYQPLLDESTAPPRPLSALASLPSYHSAYSSDAPTLPTPSEPNSAASWTRVGRSTARSSRGWRASLAETAHGAREATRGTIERMSGILSRGSATPDGLGTRGTTTRGAPIGQVHIPPLVQYTPPALERRRSMDDWWAQVVQKSEEG